MPISTKSPIVIRLDVNYIVDMLIFYDWECRLENRVQNEMQQTGLNVILTGNGVCEKETALGLFIEWKGILVNCL